MSDLGLSTLMAGCAHVYTEAELRAKLEQSARTGKPLRVKLGMDPTAPDIHLGHCVQLQKLRQFQDLGHQAVLIIGDFTSRIGDPTGRSKTRPMLTDAEIDANAQTYLEQAGRVLDLSPGKIELRRNSEWLAKMSFADVIKLAGRMTVGQMLKRDDFRQRFEAETPISIHELLYPLVQGWDSVNIHADVELGGTDQTYNNLVGRELQTQMGQAPQVVLILPLLRGLDGEKKMSKSLGNYIGVTEPPTQIFGKTMSIPDHLLEEWFALATRVAEAEYKSLIAQHPMQAKALLARRIGERFYTAEQMVEAEAWWRSHFSGKKTVDVMAVRVPASELNEQGFILAWKLAWLAHEQEISRSEARRMVENGAFEFDGEKVTDPNALLPVAAGKVFRAGRHRKGESVKQPLLAEVVLQNSD